MGCMCPTYLGLSTVLCSMVFGVRVHPVGPFYVVMGWFDFLVFMLADGLETYLLR